MNKSKIFCFLNSASPGWYVPVALAEDGTCLAEHASSSKGFAMHDIGITSDWKHDVYKKHYPDGFELIWLDGEELKTNEEFRKACEFNRLMAEKQTTSAMNFKYHEPIKHE